MTFEGTMTSRTNEPRITPAGDKRSPAAARAPLPLSQALGLLFWAGVAVAGLFIVGTLVTNPEAFVTATFGG